ncbi:hypothetical protein LPJ54_005992 [Coemansia sp. RSA 1824]|nr:hypothetical protein LPJ54_005992 [Coemansia sp. RSA 1824]
MAPGTSFSPILSDVLSKSSEKVTRVVFVAGKLYYDLVKAYAEQSSELTDKIAIVRLEEICPFPRDELASELERFPNVQEYVWCQEETMNAGAFTYVQPRIQSLLPNNNMLRYIGRAPLAAPVTGISNVFKAEQSRILQEVFTGI